jgi:RNA polymerase-binding transcription factor DksA|tara:strand:- start:157 stop:342 length:186 start_codon:yes stop_codon:yes gene_type:complete
VSNETGTPSNDLDVDQIAAELDNVATALTRLSDGTYWTDEVTGEELPAEVLAADPTRRRLS